MSSTACWGTNNIENEVAWVYFGYGSQYDLSGFWISLEALKSLSRLDIHEMNIWYRNGDKVHYDNISPAQQYEFSSLSIMLGDYNKELEWFQKVRDLRQYYIKNPEEVGSEQWNKDKEIEKNCEFMYRLTEKSHLNKEWLETAEPVSEEYIAEMLSEEAMKKDEQREQLKVEQTPTIENSWDGKLSDFQATQKHPRYMGKNYERNVGYVHNDGLVDEIGNILITWFLQVPPDYYTMGGVISDGGWKCKEVCPSADWYVFGGELVKNRFVDSNPNRNYEDPEMGIANHDVAKYHRILNWEILNNWKGQE